MSAKYNLANFRYENSVMAKHLKAVLLNLKYMKGPTYVPHTLREINKLFL